MYVSTLPNKYLFTNLWKASSKLILYFFIIKAVIIDALLDIP